MSRAKMVHRNVIAAHAVLGLLALTVLVPVLLHGQWFNSHEGARYPLLADHFRTAFIGGQWYPRWLTDLNGGNGYPTFCFYQPAFFFLFLGLSWLPRYPLYPLYASVALLLWVAAVGAYKLALTLIAEPKQRESMRAQIAGITGAALFLLTPYVWVNLYVRGDLSELMALALTPWPFYFLLRLRERILAGRTTAPVLLALGLSLALVIYAHPVVPLFLLPTLLFIALGQGLDRTVRSSHFRAYGARAVLGVALGLTLSAPYWLTVFQLGPNVSLEQLTVGRYQAHHHVVYVPQLFSRLWTFLDSYAGNADEMSFQLGLVHFGLAVMGAWFARRDRFAQATAVAYLVLIVLMTPAGVWFWRHVELAKMVQFPWRILSVTASLQLILLVYVLRRLVQRPIHDRVLVAACLGLVFGTVLWHKDQIAIRQPLDVEAHLAQHRTQRFTYLRTFANMNEFLPKTVKSPDSIVARQTEDVLIEMESEGEVVLIPQASAHRFVFRVITPRPTDVLIHHIYFPGWRMQIDGREVPRAALEAKLQEDGRIRLDVPAGTHQVEVYYDGPPGWRRRNLVIVCLLGMFAVFWFWERRLR